MNGFEVLAAATGKPIPELQRMVSEGKVSADTFITAFNDMQGPLAKFNGLMDAQSRTIQGMFSTLKDTVSQGLGNMAQPLADSLQAAFPAINQAVSDLFTSVGPSLAAIAGQLGQAFGDLVDDPGRLGIGR